MWRLDEKDRISFRDFIVASKYEYMRHGFFLTNKDYAGQADGVNLYHFHLLSLWASTMWPDVSPRESLSSDCFKVFKVFREHTQAWIVTHWKGFQSMHSIDSILFQLKDNINFDYE